MNGDQESTPSEQATAPNPQTPTPQVQNTSHRKYQIIIAVLVLVILAGAGLWWMASHKTAQPESTSASTPVKVATQLQPADVTTKIKGVLAAKYTLVTADSNKLTKGQLSVRQEKGSPSYKPDGYNFYTSYDDGSSLGILPFNPNPTSSTLPGVTDKEVRSDIASTYTDLGLVKTGSHGNPGDGGGVDTYTGKGLLCTIDTADNASEGSDAACGSLDKYPAAAAQVKPFAGLLSNLEPNSYLGGLKITNSIVTGYQRAELDIGYAFGGGGAKAMFYKKDGASWTYFVTGQESPLCTAYTTLDLRNAYKGQQCFDAKGNDSTVK